MSRGLEKVWLGKGKVWGNCVYRADFGRGI